MISAARAAKDTAAVKRRIARAQRARAMKDAEAHRKQLRWERDVVVPEVMKGLDVQIKAAIAAGQTTASFYRNSQVGFQTEQILKKRLEREGFIVRIDKHEWREELDSPGGSSMTVVVTWERK